MEPLPLSEISLPETEGIKPRLPLGLTLLFACTVFLSAFLLFQVQPLIARLILPWFGGSAAVWATCMLFFQLVLLLGYLYAHWITGLAPDRQVLLHACLLALALILLPIIPSPAWKPAGGANPTLGILGLLGVTVGVPYFLLSTTGPLVQAWYARATRGRLPYRLFALSNFASLLALLSYPPLVEPYLATRTQALTWSWGFGVFAVLAVASAMKSRAGGDETPAESAATLEDAGPAPALGAKLMWIALPAAASTMLLAVTNHLTQDVASIPFLWILPLALYLLSFVLTFDAAGWYRRWLMLPLMAIALAGMTYRLYSDTYLSGLKPTIALYTIGFFLCCMFCHGELARRKPHPRYLTSFYLMMSVGGALGGVFVGLVAPYVFPGNFELPISIALTILLALHVLFHDPSSPFRQGRLIVVWCLLAAYAAGNLGILGRVIREWTEGTRVMARNFYGGLRVSDDGDDEEGVVYRKLMHGNINHGQQALDPVRGKEPTTYYCRESGVGLALLEASAHGPVRAGLVGLGAGTLAAYGRPGDYFRFYEINPLVLRLATTEFTYTRSSGAQIDFALGDARLSLDREAPQNFDVLAVDAFSGDSIPVHLLTREAFALYFRHLKPDGVLAVHISNRYLNLKPVVKQAAKVFGKQAREIDTDDNDDRSCFGCTWILVTGRKGYFEQAGFDTATPLDSSPDLPVWTDDYSNLFRILK